MMAQRSNGLRANEHRLRNTLTVAAVVLAPSIALLGLALARSSE